jgi:3-deoxy-D-manno-octulosonic-acid transferase
MFLQDENSAKLIESIGLKNYKVIGDTRFDRVLEIKQNFKEIEAIKNFKGNKKLIIAGSTWEKDVDLVLTAFKSLKESAPSLVLVPHDVSEKSIQETILQVQAANLSYSLFNETIDNTAQVLIVNVMGLLSKIYFYADCSYIGGGFNGGIHNCLEASVYGKAISFCGKDYVKFNEAVDLMKLGAASLVNDANELTDRFEDYLSDEFKAEELAQKLDTYFMANSNVTDKVLLAIDL